jgi:hypothetical protein
LNLSCLDDKTLLNQTRKQASLEREATAKMLVYLREVHKRRLYSDLHYSSLFDFCVRDLGWSEGQTSRRISAARLVEARPEVGIKIAKGEMSLGVAAELARFFKSERPDENKKDELIAKVSGKSQRESAKILAGESTNPLPHKRESMTVTSPSTNRLALNISDELLEKLSRIRDLMGHKDISTYENLLNAMADVVLKKVDSERVASFSAERKPKIKCRPENTDHELKQKCKLENAEHGPKKKSSRYIPAKIRRRVKQKANHKCEKCGGTHALQVDHVAPVYHGGDNQPSNLRILCRSCNQREAILKIGREQMDLFLR